ncbi:MAG: hypothetical protein IJT47_04655 [Selenomonadaceae bacterium]|nr:hypothetical protein [Selenomonadaceae bacterium]
MFRLSLTEDGSAFQSRDDTRGSFMVMELERGSDPRITVVRMKNNH